MAGEHSLFGPVDPAGDAGYDEDGPKRKGFFTDTSICIGCKACEVACKEWNDVPADHFDMLGSSYDNSFSLNANQWRHVAFIEQQKPMGEQESGLRRQAQEKAQQQAVDLGMPAMAPPEVMLPESGEDDAVDRPDFRWLMSSDVCKHCTHAACLDVCPTGSLFRSEFGTVVVQDDICNGCGYCVPACPYGVIERRKGPEGAQACPTQSIQFGDVEELRERANARVEQLHEAGIMDAQLYGNDPDDGVGGAGAFFLLMDKPEVYGFPPDPVVTTKDLPDMFRKAGLAAATLLAGAAISFLGSRQ
jgi:formate dehydrogenase iron-sulfur subunit